MVPDITTRYSAGVLGSPQPTPYYGVRVMYSLHEVLL